MKHIIDASALKYAIGFVIVFLIRLIPFRIPNVEPVMATMMPFAKHFGHGAGFLFPFLSIVLFDSVTSGWGVWTWVTASTYGVLGIAASVFFQHRSNTSRHYVYFAIVSTLVYDAITGLTIGPLFWGQSFTAALVGQIPFTFMHLAGNGLFAAVVSPVIYRIVVTNEYLTMTAVVATIRRVLPIAHH